MNEATCSEPDCPKPVAARMLCSAHYHRRRRAGTLPQMERHAPNRPTWHVLSEVDREARTAVCAICGPVAIRVRSSGRVQCMTTRKRQKGFGSLTSIASRRRYVLRTVYRLDRADYEAMLAEQDGVCAICGGSDGDRELAVDHDHSCCGPDRACRRCVRALLCARCNLMVGRAEANPSRYLGVADYLRRFAIGE